MQQIGINYAPVKNELESGRILYTDSHIHPHKLLHINVSQFNVPKQKLEF